MSFEWSNIKLVQIMFNSLNCVFTLFLTLLFILLFILICECRLVNVDGVSTIFSRISTHFQKIKIIQGISLRKCGYECHLRLRCKSLNYQTSGGICYLGENAVSSHDTVRKAGYVLVFGFPREMNSLACGPRLNCNRFQTCFPSSHCEITECDARPYTTPNGIYEVKGDMYNIGSKLSVSCGIELHRTTCGNNSHWTVELSRPIECPDCIGCSTPDDGGIITIHANIFGLSNDVTAYCDLQHSNNWLVFQRRQDGSENFTRGWEDYVNGFGHPCREHWLGLETLHKITSSSSANYELRIDMKMFDGDIRYALYSYFRLDGEADNYRLHIGHYTGDADGDGLEHANGMAFTTKDNDNDNWDDGNCAYTYYGAWWYHGNNCLDANLNGGYVSSPGVGGYRSGIVWEPWTGDHHSLRKVEMKIRRISN